MTTVFNEKINRKKLKKLKLYSFNSLKDLTYNMFENKEDLMKIVISRTNTNLIRHNKKKVFFIHPFFKSYACDIHGDVFDLKLLNQPRIYAFQNILTLDIHFNNVCSHPIQYDYNKFVSQALHLYRSDILKFHFENDYEEALFDEAELKKVEEYDINKFNKDLYDIIHYEKKDTDDDNDSDNDSHNDSDNDSHNDSDNDSHNDSD